MSVPLTGPVVLQFMSVPQRFLTYTLSVPGFTAASAGATPAWLGQDDDGASGGDGQTQLMEVQRT
jgi:hypothetical protein